MPLRKNTQQEGSKQHSTHMISETGNYTQPSGSLSTLDPELFSHFILNNLIKLFSKNSVVQDPKS